MVLPKVILASSKDWDRWICFLEIQAGYDVWKLIDPELPDKPASLSKPQHPKPVPVGPNGKRNASAIEYYKYEKELYHMEYGLWKKQHDSFTKINNKIFNSISVNNRAILQHIKKEPYDLLRALKQRVAPTDQERLFQAEKEYEKLKKGPGKDVEKWVTDFSNLYWKGKKAKMAEIVNVEHYYWDFTCAINNTAPVMAVMLQIEIEKNMEGDDKQREEKLFEAINKYIHYIRYNDIVRSSTRT